MPETLQYRFALPDEIPAIGAMVAHSFPGSPRTPAWWHEQLADPVYGGGAETLFVGHVDGDFKAALQLHTLRQWIAGTAIPVAGVGTVSITPTHRKRRLGGELMCQALRAARERGDVGSALYPFRTSFYKKLGYGQAGEAMQYQIAPSWLPDSDLRLRVELLESDNDRAEALTLYKAWCASQTGQLDRNTLTWAFITGQQDRALFGYRNAAGGLEGYALVVYRTDLPREHRFLEVEEILWATPDARRGLYAWLSSLDDQWDQILMRSLPSERLGDWLSEARMAHHASPVWGLWAPRATLMTGPMFRLLDAAAGWNGRTVTAGAPLSFDLEIEDAQLPENAGHWQLVCDGGRASLTREATSASSGTLRMDISTLSRLYIGSMAPTIALSIGLLEADRPETLPALDAMIAIPEPWTFDRF